MNKLTKNELMNIYNEGENLLGKPIFILFKADWWGPCKIFKQVLNGVIPGYSDKINFYEVDIEEEPQMSALFRVMSVPNIAMIRKDGSKEQAVGGMDKSQLKYWLGGLIS